MSLPYVLVGLALAGLGYTYLVYPVLLWIVGFLRGGPDASGARNASRGGSALPGAAEDGWPLVTISLPVYNEAAQIRETLESLLALDYPRDRLQVVVVSDASDDGTDDIVAEYADRGVELVRLPARSGKTAAEAAAAERVRGEVVVNTDASIRIRPDALRPLVAAFRDPEVGVASGRDVSVGEAADPRNLGEAGYVGYEMRVRDLETRVGSIVGASGCLYAIRPDLHRMPLPASLSRDFAAALHARQRGFRAVSVSEAVCYVPRTDSLPHEYRRKVRTMVRGMQTLWHKRALLNPLRHGVFAWMLFSHKVCRWALPWLFLMGAAGLAGLAFGFRGGLGVILVAVVLLVGGAVVAAAFSGRRLPRVLALPAWLVMGNVAAIHAFLRAVGGMRAATWEPTRRSAARTV